MQSLMFLDCFVQKLSKKNIWGGGRLDPLGKGRVNRNKLNDLILSLTPENMTQHSRIDITELMAV